MDTQDPIKVRLLEAAGEEFAGKGYDATRIRAICERARANIAAVNYHFGDKKQLYLEAVLDAHRCGVDAGGEDSSPLPSLAPAEQLRCFVHHFLSRVLAINNPDDWRNRLMLREMLHPTSASDVLIREAIRPKFERLEHIMRQFCPQADDRKLNALAFSVIGQCLHYKMARTITQRLIGQEASDALDLDYLTDHITSFCLAALGCVPSLDEAGNTVPDGALAAN
jgi:TetR/AcrR family transcriptional regulator, regulator of cefoperazone and chloramphenicol sensitivity